MPESPFWKEKISKGKERRKNERERVKGIEADRREYDLYEGGPSWWIYNSGLDTGQTPFLNTFSEVLPHGGESLKKFIEHELYERAGEAVGIEFCGPGSAVFAEFTSGFFKKTAGITLIDDRVSFASDPTDTDKENNHSVIAGDIFDPKTDDLVKSWLAGDRADVIFERAFGAKNHMQDPYRIVGQVQNWYMLLREKGMMFAQVPTFMQHLIEPWKELLSSSSIELIAPRDGKVFLMRKHTGSPDRLPLLGALAIRRMSP